jgi:hypothetical protein
MAGRTSDWKEELGRFLEPFLVGWVTRRGAECALFTC